MAKKKSAQNQEDKQQLAMDEASLEKLQSLKSLNDILLKQTVELRQQVNSLKESKGSLESALTRSDSLVGELRSEFTQLEERFVGLEVERAVVVVFAGQLGEVILRERDGFKVEKVEIEGKLKCLERKMEEVLKEKGELEIAARDRFESQMVEMNDMRERLVEAEKRETVVLRDFEELKAEYAYVMKEKEEMEKRIDSIETDKCLLEKSLIEYNKEIDEIKGEIERIGKEKGEIEQERDVEVMKRSKLEDSVSGLNVRVLGLQNEEERLRQFVADLEEKLSECVEKEKEMERNLDELVKEKDEKEMMLGDLIDEKSLVDKHLHEALKNLDEHERKLAEMADEKSKISEDNVKKENVIVELQNQVVGLRNVVSGIEKTCSEQQEKNLDLESELSSIRGAFERVIMERDEARKEIYEEKLNGESLKQKIMGMEKNIEANLELIEKEKAENSNLTNEKKELESHCNRLKKEITSLDKELADSHNDLFAIKEKSELADSKSIMVLAALRNTTEFVASKDEKDGPIGSYANDKQQNGEIEPHVLELEAIKSAFRCKENNIEDMKRRVEFLENSVAEAQKKKSFLTIISSATSLFAAISLAYLARGH